MSVPINPMFNPGPIQPVNPGFKPLGYDHGIATYGHFPGGGDIHDHFGVNPNGGVTWGVTTIRLPGGAETHLKW